MRRKRGMIFGSLLVASMLAFELFNYSTTDFALANLLGDLRFLGLRWAMILAIAFCGIDFAGVARMFTPEQGYGENVETWYLMLAWFLAAALNAVFTWWAISLALLEYPSLGNEILSRSTLLTAVPVFVAIIILLIRILMIGTISMTSGRMFAFTPVEGEGVFYETLRPEELPRTNQTETLRVEGGVIRTKVESSDKARKN